jgi:hypothetical protein
MSRKIALLLETSLASQRIEWCSDKPSPECDSTAGVDSTARVVVARFTAGVDSTVERIATCSTVEDDSTVKGIIACCTKEDSSVEENIARSSSVESSNSESVSGLTAANSRNVSRVRVALRLPTPRRVGSTAIGWSTADTRERTKEGRGIRSRTVMHTATTPAAR